MKIINAISLICIFSLMHFNSKKLSAQVLIDSTYLPPIMEAVDAVLDYQSGYQENVSKFEWYISKRFCTLNFLDQDKADEFLDFVLRPNFLSTHSKHKFLVSNFKCFSDSQKKIISGYMNKDLKPMDWNYHEIVSKYKLFSQQKYLMTNSSDTLFSELKRDAKDGEVSEYIEIQLRNLTTLYNLGIREDEDWFLNEINGLYNDWSSSNGEIIHVFTVSILPNSIALMDSKKAVTSTLYLLDLEYNSNLSDQDCLALFEPAMWYFMSCIEPKLKTGKIKILAYTDLESNKDKIKDLILNDDSIWADEIRR